MLNAFLKTVSTAVLEHPLNPTQETAITSGPSESLFLVAGPGSGKTTVLALRVLKLVFVDRTPPEAIVATTFTKKAAKELRSRILGWGDRLRKALPMSGMPYEYAEWVATVDLNALWTGTLDSLAQTVLGQYRQAGTQPPVLVEEFIARALMLREGLFTNGRYNNASLGDYIAAIRGSSYRLSPSEKARILLEIRQRISNDDIDVTAYRFTAAACSLCDGGHPHPGVDCACDALDDYAKFLDGQGIADYVQMEVALLDGLRSGGALAEFTSGLQQVLVDEYQDTNLLQERIYFELARHAVAHGGSIAVVGDDDQSLYRFRGATVDLFHDFPARARTALGVTPGTLFLAENYRSTAAVVDFCNDFAVLDPLFQAVRVQGKPSIVHARPVVHNPKALGMFRDNVADLARDLASLISQVFQGSGYQLPTGEPVERDPAGGVGDCAFLSFSPAERNSAGRPRLPLLLRDELRALPQPLLVFNPRGEHLADLPSVQRLCGLMLECIDPGSVQQSSARLPGRVVDYLNAWRGQGQAALAAAPTRTDRRDLPSYVARWQAATAPPASGWPGEVALGDLAYKLVTWIPEMQNDIEGLVHLEVVLRTVTEGARFSSYGGHVVFRTPTLQANSVKRALWDVFAPLALGAVEIEEDLLETLPRDRLNVLSFHQAKGLEFPLVIVDVGSDFSRNNHAQAFKRFPADGASSHRLEDELRQFSSTLSPPSRSPLDRAFDDLVRSYFVAFSRTQDVLLLVGHSKVANAPAVRNVATGWDRSGTWHWGDGLPNLLMI